jgi:hypothetical protein
MGCGAWSMGMGHGAGGMEGGTWSMWFEMISGRKTNDPVGVAHG